VETQFEDYVQGEWLEIGTDIAYSDTANAVVDAVIQDESCGQTAARVETKGGGFVAASSHPRLILYITHPRLILQIPITYPRLF
jgi:hypothetical protein